MKLLIDDICSENINIWSYFSDHENKVLQLHSEMVLELNGKITPSKDEILNQTWTEFTEMLRNLNLLSDKEVGDLKTIYDVFRHLMKKGKINHGRYDTVKGILQTLKLIECLDIITKFEEKMEDVKQGKRRQKYYMFIQIKSNQCVTFVLL